MTDAPKLNLVEFPNNSLQDIPQKLRDLADAFEEGHFGKPESCLVVQETEILFEVFGLGCDTDGTVAHYLLACAQRKLEQPFLNKFNGG